MEYYNNILCISGSELIHSDANPDGVMTKNTFCSLSRRNRINIVRRGGGEGTPALVKFESLPKRYIRLIKESKGDEQIEAQRQKIMSYLTPDAAAETFFKDFRAESKGTSKSLDEDVQRLYRNNAAVLNALKEAWDEHVLNNRARNKRPLSGKFWGRAVEAIRHLPKEWACELPANPRRLQIKLNDYISFGYEEILSGKWGNKNTVKITPEAGDWLMAQWSSRIKIVTIEQLHARYNQYADGAGWKKIKTAASIREFLYRPEIEEQWYAARYGELAYKEKYLRQHRTKLPTFRDSLWYSDGTKLNFYYQDENGNPKTCNVYEVIDVYSEVFLGYHISKSEDFEAQYISFKMAIRASGHKPYELKYDNQGGHRKLENGGFLGLLSNHAISTAPYNGRSKTIESIFGRFQAQHLHEEWYFTGQNITATKAESRANMEFILANLKNLPTLEEVKQKYLEHRTAWNNDKHPKADISRMEMYRTSANEKTQKVDFLDMLTIFGIMTKAPSTYRSSGIEIEVKRQKYVYEVLDADGMPDNDFMRRNVGRKFFVRYDLEDMSIISLYEQDASGMRFITLAQTYIKVQRNIQEQTSEDALFIRKMEISGKLQRICNAKNINERLEKYDLHPNQHGLNVPKIKGLNIRKKPVDIGELQKEVSNMTEIETQKKASRKAIRKAEKEANRQEVDDQNDFYKDRIKILELTLN